MPSSPSSRDVPTALPVVTDQPPPAPFPDMVWIPGGTFRMGSDDHYPEERPAHLVHVDGFWIDRYPVTNTRFAQFVAETKHVTLAEIAPDPGDYPGALPELLHPGSMVFVKPSHAVDLRFIANWWCFMLGADWRHPQGLDSDLQGLEHHPVLHVAYADAEAFARWAGKVLPTEAEWEHAARGGLAGAPYAWGQELMPEGRVMANTWQGRFPYENLLVDGYEGTSPVGVYPPNGFGVYDMIGNVWEWTSDWYRPRHEETHKPGCCVPRNPRGALEQESYDPVERAIHIPRKVLKGGSHLCAPNYCRRYRPAARLPEAIDTSTSHVGFRCVVRVPASQ